MTSREEALLAEIADLVETIQDHVERMVNRKRIQTLEVDNVRMRVMQLMEKSAVLKHVHGEEQSRQQEAKAEAVATPEAPPVNEPQAEEAWAEAVSAPEAPAEDPPAKEPVSDVAWTPPAGEEVAPLPKTNVSDLPPLPELDDAPIPATPDSVKAALEAAQQALELAQQPVSYTHLTLPTTSRV